MPTSVSSPVTRTLVCREWHKGPRQPGNDFWPRPGVAGELLPYTRARGLGSLYKLDGLHVRFVAQAPVLWSLCRGAVLALRHVPSAPWLHLSSGAAVPLRPAGHLDDGCWALAGDHWSSFIEPAGVDNLLSLLCWST